MKNGGGDRSYTPHQLDKDSSRNTEEDSNNALLADLFYLNK